jgi:outer membrane protein assembly factor BamE (lipoprotein component of BamABCDE complex)
MYNKTKKIYMLLYSKKFNFLVLPLFALFFFSCSLTYSPEVIEGRSLNIEKVNLLKVGMTKKGVAEILGSNTINDPFLAKDRWDYLLKKNKINELSPSISYHIIVYFADDVLESFQIKKWETDE